MKKQAGFTLLELIIVISLSAGVFMVASGIFVQALKIQRRALFIQKVQENISLVLELMAREIRVSNLATADTNCPSFPSSILSITHPVNGSINYLLSGADLHRRLTVGGIDTILNSAGIPIEQLSFCISGNSTNDDAQPRVTILLKVSNGYPNPDSEYYISLNMQTTVSQRFLSD